MTIDKASKRPTNAEDRAGGDTKNVDRLISATLQTACQKYGERYISRDLRTPTSTDFILLAARPRILVVELPNVAGRAVELRLLEKHFVVTHASGCNYGHDEAHRAINAANRSAGVAAGITFVYESFPPVTTSSANKIDTL